MACLLTCAAFTQDGKFEPLNVKLGQWQVTESYTTTGLPSGMGTRNITYKNCITTKDLGTNPFNDPDEHCTWNVVKSNASDMEVRGTSCDLGMEDMKANVDLKLHVVDLEHVTGSAEWTANGNGNSINGHATGSGKWISATCAAE